MAHVPNSLLDYYTTAVMYFTTTLPSGTQDWSELSPWPDKAPQQVSPFIQQTHMSYSNFL